MIIFSSWSKRIFSHFSKLISQLTEGAFQVFLGRGILKLCSKFKGEHPRWSAISIKLLATLLKLYFVADVLLQIFCIFSKRLFIITHLDPPSNYMFKVNNRNTITRCEICWKLTIKTPEWRQWRRSGVFIVNREHISRLVLVFPWLTLSR